MNVGGRTQVRASCTSPESASHFSTLHCVVTDAGGPPCHIQLRMSQSLRLTLWRRFLVLERELLSYPLLRSEGLRFGSRCARSKANSFFCPRDRASQTSRTATGSSGCVENAPS